MVKRAFNIVGLSFNLIFVIGLLISGLSVFISPEKTTIPAILGMFFLFFMLANLVFVLYWLMKIKWYFVFSFLALLLMTKNITNIFPVNKKQPIEASSSGEIKILSYNVRLFNFYKKNKSETKNAVLSYIIDTDADIVCMQEFGYGLKNEFLTRKDILSVLGKKYKYYHIEISRDYLQDRKNPYGIATFSKHKIVNTKLIETPSKDNLAMYTDMKIGDKIIRVFNCHLESNQLTHNDRKLVAGLMDSIDKKALVQIGGILSKKMSAAFKRRALQVDKISEVISQSTLPTFLCGDFNDTPVSYAYRKMRGSLKDAFAETNTGLGITYNQGLFRFRIDYILHSEGIHPFGFKVDKVSYSDHYPVYCYFENY